MQSDHGSKSLPRIIRNHLAAGRLDDDLESRRDADRRASDSDQTASRTAEHVDIVISYDDALSGNRISRSDPNISHSERPQQQQSPTRTTSDLEAVRGRTHPGIHHLKSSVVFCPVDDMIIEELCPYELDDQLDHTHQDLHVDREPERTSTRRDETRRIKGMISNMIRYSTQINVHLNMTLESVAYKLTHSPMMARKMMNKDGDGVRSFDEWVGKNIQVRECHKFVKKCEDVDNDPICHCRNKLSKHLRPGSIEMPEDATWKQPENTTLTQNTAFGKVMFEDVEQSIDEAQYVRIATDYSEPPTIDKLKPLFIEFWKLHQPDLLISVSGGAKSFNVSQDICASFQQGLLNAAKSTNAWIITGGQYCGVMKLVGDVIGRTIAKSRIPTIGVGNWGKTWKNEILLNHNRQRDVTYYPIEKPAKGFATLDPNHTHHFLVDDGTTGNDGIEYGFRAALETLICDIYKMENVPLPMVCIMVEGGMRSLEIAISTLRKGNTLVVLKGSGRASDILCYGFENSIEMERENGKRERTMPSECEQEIKKLIAKDFSKYKIEKEMLDVVLEISAYRDFVTIFSIHNPEPLDFYILSSLMKSSANANVLAAAKMRQMRLAITWGHAKIAREFIFSQKLYKFSADELNNLMLFSITKQRTDFVKLLMDYGCDLKQFLTAHNLKRLYNSLDKKSGGYRLLMEKAERKRRKMQNDNIRNAEEGSVRGDGDRIVIQLNDVGGLLGRIMQGSYTSMFNKKKHDKAATFDNPFDLMTIYCALDNCQAMALLFWEKSRTPMATGIIAHRIYNYLDMMEAKWARMDEEMTEQLENAASQFEMLSCSLMTACYHNYEKREWVNILEVKMVDWGNLSLFEVGQITNAKNFLSHAAYQSYLTDIWMGEIHPSTPFFLLAVAAVTPPLPMFLQYNCTSSSTKNMDMNLRDHNSPDKDEIKGKQPNPLKRFKLFYTSPAIKFILNCIFYLIFLGLYMCRLLSPNVCISSADATNMIGPIDYYLIVFVVSTIPIEISQVIGGNTKSVLKKFKIYLKQLYNVIDLLAIVIFLTAFSLKFSIRCEDTERYKLSKFSAYHYYRLFASFCFILYSIRFIQMFEMNAKIGPKIFMLKRMAVDLFFFLFLLGVFTFSYCVASEALLYPFHTRPVNRTIFAAFRRAYFNVFGDLNIDQMSDKLVDGHCNNETWLFNFYDGPVKLSQDGVRFSDLYKAYDERGVTFKASDCEPDSAVISNVEATTVGITNYYICFFLLCCYVLTVNIMLINLLIAIFSNTYVDSKAKSGIIYKTQRASVIVEFEERPWLPNPLSLIYFLIIMPLKMLKKCCTVKAKEGSIRQERRKNTDSSKSARSRRAQLIEAECMVLLQRKKQLDSQNGLQIIELQNKKIKDSVERIAAELKSMTLKQHKETLSNLSTIKRPNLFGCTVSQAMQARHHPAARHKYALTRDAYAKHDVTRVQIPPDALDWETHLDFYDPPEVTDDTVVTDEPIFPDKIKFNCESETINRISYYRSYLVDGGDPLNVRGRTGLKGRGIFRRWGPNHYAVTIATRWYRPGTGSNVYVKQKPVIEVLLIQDLEEEAPRYFHLPSVHITTEDPARHANRKFIKTICYSGKDASLYPFNKTGSVKSNGDRLLEEAFSHCKHVYRGYFDDIHNTDNAWMEIDAINVHFEKALANKPLENDSAVSEVSWQKLDSKIHMRNNEAWILKRVCQLQRSYNPYSGESLL